ncbi:MAG: aspartate--tRNA(Asp/Asn) ligase [Gemmatimonadota bacterium]|nr:MAG: aspartate--tRNA(Asp/Asn) ligase [Gemmatimonadota bacterium]
MSTESSLRTAYRSHTCGELRADHDSQEVRLVGWVDTVRDHGGVFFVHLRDRFGATQVTVHPDRNADAAAIAKDLHAEWVIAVRGVVNRRPDGMTNDKMPTGAIEVIADELTVLNKAAVLPFDIREADRVSEELRLQYRFLDLRNPGTMEPLIFRHKLCMEIRQSLSDQGFVEIETPFLTKSTPEGARDFLIPSRLQRGSYYALPQSPQIFKQILMVSGLDRYFQIVRCFRDEDLRADRQPEFTQLDMELSFVDEDDVLGVLEVLVCDIFKNLHGRELERPFPRIPYAEAMDKYGSDAPDLRHGHELFSLTDWAKSTTVKFLLSAVEDGGAVRALRVPGGAKFSRKDLSNLETVAKDYGAGGLLWFKFEGGEIKSPIAKFLDEAQLAAVQELSGAQEGDVVLAVSDKNDARVKKSMGELRNHLARTEGWIKPGQFAVAWVVDFPLFYYDEEEGRYYSEHHPFTAPKVDNLELLESDPGSVLARAYDLVLNGHEIGGGSIRIHEEPVQEQVFRLLGIDEEEARAKFGFLLDALKFGAPPHGGIALGLDRMAMVLNEKPSLRDVIAFPKTSSGSCPLTGAPADVDTSQLEELGIREIPKPEKTRGEDEAG